MRAVFVTATSMATGETVTALAVAQEVREQGGQVWVIASPLAAQLACPTFGRRVFELTPDLETNQRLWRRVLRRARPDVIVFSDLAPLRTLWLNPVCPLADIAWLHELARSDAELVWTNLMGSTRNMRELAAGEGIPSEIADAFRPVLERMRMMLPCPLHEPGPVLGRRGVPYRSLRLPLRLGRHDRARVRARFLGDRYAERGILMLHSVPSWSYRWARFWAAPLYAYLAELLWVYLRDLGRPVTLVSVNDGTLLRPSPALGLRVVNLQGMPPADYERLLLACDLVLTENITSYQLGKALGNVPGMVLVNSFSLLQLRARLELTSPVRRLVEVMEGQAPGCIYPHIMYPFMTPDGERRRVPILGLRDRQGLSQFLGRFGQEDMVRVGKLPSSPFLRAELYGEQATRDLFHDVLADPGYRAELRQADLDYIRRLRALDDGAAVLRRLVYEDVPGATVLKAAS